MANINDYLTWRGDLTLAERPFNDVDNLVCSVLSYVDFMGIVPRPGAGTITVAEACRILLDRAGDDLTPYVHSFAKVGSAYLRALGSSARFGGAGLHDYVDVIDPDRSLQFGALTMDVAPGLSFVSFRGTDGTLVGWREDFMLSFRVTEAQRQATRYLAAAAQAAVARDSHLYVGGHSKGGNLASFAAASVPPELSDRLLVVWSNDGPGMDPAIMPHGPFALLGNRLRRIQPAYSVVGQLFDRPEEPRLYVRSDARGALQHDPMSWQVTPDGLCVAEGLLPECVLVDRVFANWIGDMPMERRIALTDQLFDALGAGGATTFDEIMSSPRGAQKVLAAMGEIDPLTRRVINDLARQALSATTDTVREAAGTAASIAMTVAHDMPARVLGKAMGAVREVAGERLARTADATPETAQSPKPPSRRETSEITTAAANAEPNDAM